MLKNIYSEAKNFRKAILNIPPDNFRFGIFGYYPWNCCEWTSLLLAKYLIEYKEYEDISLLRGENKYKKSIRHVWLEVNGVTVDITANQFSSTNKTVIVDISSEWHQKRYDVFKTETPNISFHDFHKHSKEELLHDYRLILDKLNIARRMMIWTPLPLLTVS